MKRFAFLMCMVWGAPPAQAQQRELFVPQYRQSSNQNDDTTRKVVHEFGECAVKKNRAAAAEFVLNQRGEDEEREKRLLNRVIDEDCFMRAAGDGAVEATLTFPGDTIRYALADALVRREFAKTPLTSFQNVPALPQRYLNETRFQPKPGSHLSKKELEKLSKRRADAQVAIFLAGFGECVVRTEPVGSDGLLMTDVTSAEEAAQIARLKPALAKCISNQQTITLNKASIRGTIALNYYRLAKASPAPQAQALLKAAE